MGNKKGLNMRTITVIFLAAFAIVSCGRAGPATPEGESRGYVYPSN